MKSWSELADGGPGGGGGGASGGGGAGGGAGGGGGGLEHAASAIMASNGSAVRTFLGHIDLGIFDPSASRRLA